MGAPPGCTQPAVGGTQQPGSQALCGERAGQVRGVRTVLAGFAYCKLCTLQALHACLAGCREHMSPWVGTCKHSSGRAAKGALLQHAQSHLFVRIPLLARWLTAHMLLVAAPTAALPHCSCLYIKLITVNTIWADTLTFCPTLHPTPPPPPRLPHTPG